MFKIGDIVWATGRKPMPESMEKELLKPQTIEYANHPLYRFKNGWSVNVCLGDKIFKIEEGEE